MFLGPLLHGRWIRYCIYPIVQLITFLLLYHDMSLMLYEHVIYVTMTIISPFLMYDEKPKWLESSGAVFNRLQNEHIKC